MYLLKNKLYDSIIKNYLKTVSYIFLKKLVLPKKIYTITLNSYRYNHTLSVNPFVYSFSLSYEK